MSTTTYRASAFLEAARRLGVPVVVASEREQALAGLNPAGHLMLDLADPARAARAIVELARSQPLSAVIAADDDGVEVAAQAASALGLRHHPPAAVRIARDKLLMRRALQSAGLPGPGFVAVDVTVDPARLAPSIRFPCVVKPTSWSASRGVMRADDAEGLTRALQRLARLLDLTTRRASPSREVLIEDFLPGPEVAVEGLVSEGRLETLAIFDKPDPLDGPFFEETIYVTPSRHPSAVTTAIETATQSAVSALGLNEGPVHAELRIGEGSVVLVEIAPRSIGGLCSRALRFEGSVSLEELILRHALRLASTNPQREAAASGVMMIPIPHGGILRGVEGEERARAVRGIEEIRLTIPIGDRVIPLPEGSRYLGFVFARAEDPERVEESLRAAHRELRFDIVRSDGLEVPHSRV